MSNEKPTICEQADKQAAVEVENALSRIEKPKAGLGAFDWDSYRRIK